VAKSNTVWVSVEVLRRSKYDDGWQVDGEDGTKSWVNDDRIVDVDGPDLAIGVSTKIELSIGYAEAKGLA
jgi:hypothetical protein